MVKNIDLKESKETDEENLTLVELLSTLFRRSKFFGIITLLFFSGSVIFTLYQRTTNPVYRGNFAMMTSDPINSNSVGGDNNLGLEALAKNETNIDSATLKIFLKSPLALKGVRDELNLPNGYLRNIISIGDLSSGRGSGSVNILNVTINLQDYKLGKKIINSLSENYLRLAIDMRQKRLNDGLDFLNSQAPLVLKKNDEIIKILSENRNKYAFYEFVGQQEKIKLNIESLQSLSKARENFKLEIAQNTPPWTIISPPIMYPKPVGPNVLKYLSYGAFISISLGVLITILREKLDNVYHDPAMIIEKIGSVSLGLIPYLTYFEGIREQKRFFLENLDFQKKDNESYNDEKSSKVDGKEKIDSYQRFFYQESFRNILTSLRFLESDKEINIITITSSIPEEGKTLVNILLAKTYSELDKKVLLIDGDMRKPQLHYRLGMNNILGLSNILTDSSLELSKVIRNVKGYDNWDVITSGFVPPDPTRILSSDRMNEFVTSLKNLGKYDMIIFDSPPVIGLADASLISEKTDGMILLVSLDKVPKGLPVEAKKIMLQSGSEFLGVIINSSKENKNNLFGNKGYGYGYSYGDIYSKYSTDETLPENLTSKQIILNKLNTFFKKFLKWLDN